MAMQLCMIDWGLTCNHNSSQDSAPSNPTYHASSKVQPLKKTVLKNSASYIYFRVGDFYIYYYSYRVENSFSSLESVRKSTVIPNHVFYLSSQKRVCSSNFSLLLLALISIIHNPDTY